MATKKTNKADEKKALKRYIDQKGQWVNTTPASVKKRQQKSWVELEASLKKKSK